MTVVGVGGYRGGGGSKGVPRPIVEKNRSLTATVSRFENDFVTNVLR